MSASQDVKNNHTSVVRMKRSGGKVVQDCDVYIGRACYMGGWMLAESEWHNPFKVGNYSRQQSIEKFEEYIRANSQLMARLGELEGKRLGCWCKPEACHGDVLVKLVEEQRRVNLKK